MVFWSIAWCGNYRVYSVQVSLTSQVSLSADRNRYGEVEGGFQVTVMLTCSPDLGSVRAGLLLRVILNHFQSAFAHPVVTGYLLGKPWNLPHQYLLFSSCVKCNWKELLLIFKSKTERFNYMGNWTNGKKFSHRTQCQHLTLKQCFHLETSMSRMNVVLKGIQAVGTINK